MEQKTAVRRLVISGLLLALGLVLPFLTGQMQALGQAMSPMHIPALLAGLTCGWGWGAALGLVLPVLRSFLFGMPPLVPVALPMTVELAAYGLVCGLAYPLFRRRLKRLPAMLLGMVLAMVAGRILGGGAKALVMGLTGDSFTFAMFVSSYFTSTAPGALVHLLVIPPVALALERAHLSPNA